mgnify:CR=1 FL=1
MKIVVLDGYTVNPGDLEWQPIMQAGDVDIYERSAPDEIVSRSAGEQGPHRKGGNGCSA